MSISDNDRKKFKDYMEKRGQKVTDINVASLLEYCVEDIFEKIEKYSETTKKYTNTQKQTFKSKIGISLFNAALLNTIADNSDIDPYLAKELLESEKLEEILLKVGLYIETFPEFAYKLTIYLLTTYIKLCIEYSITPDLDLHATLKVFLEK